MVDEKTIARINALAAKDKTEGLTEEEKKEREVLRRKFIDSVLGNVKAQLDSIEIVDED